MIEANLRLVVLLPRSISSTIWSSDLDSGSNLGLERGVEKFDPSKGIGHIRLLVIRQGHSPGDRYQGRTVG